MARRADHSTMGVEREDDGVGCLDDQLGTWARRGDAARQSSPTKCSPLCHPLDFIRAPRID